MEKFYGFDLGDAESAISVLQKEGKTDPEVLEVAGAGSFVTAYANLSSGELVIGEKACYAGGAVKRRLRFKSRFLTDPESRKDIRSFASGVIGELYAEGLLTKGEDCCFYIGCPAGWDKNDREEYRVIFEKAGYPPVRIVSESRAALVSACQSRHLQVGYDILSKPVLVVDIGSSTTDFAYILSGRETRMQTAGEVRLGGGVMDELLLLEALHASKDRKAIEAVFEKSEPWKNYCEFAARRLKEKYFSDEDYWQDNPCTESVLIYYDRPLRLTLSMDRDMAEKLKEKGTPSLNGRSFKKVFTDSLLEVRSAIPDRQPELVFLTGGVSKLAAIRMWCKDVFPEAVVIMGAEPEFAVSRGLSYSGRIDEELREFRAEIEQLKNSSIVEQVVRQHIPELYRMAVDTLLEPVLTNAAIPVFDRWRNGEIRRLCDTDPAMEEEITRYLKTEDARVLLSKMVARWLKPVADELEEYTMPICVRHHVPYTALSLNSYFKLSDMDIHIDAKNVFAVEELTWLIDSVISILIGLLCGGSGIALISSGPVGIMAGALASLLILILGKGKMEKALLKMDIPKTVRRLVPKNSFRSRLESVGASVKESFYKNLAEEKNEEITVRMTDEISAQIEECLTKMAEVVEIPLGQ